MFTFQTIPICLHFTFIQRYEKYVIKVEQYLLGISLYLVSRESHWS